MGLRWEHPWKIVLRARRNEMKKSIHDEIAKVAYKLYEKEGGVHGNDLTDWLEAENIVMEKHERHARETEKQAEPIIKPPQRHRRTVKKEGAYKKG
jgi:hypothetical protein